MFNKPCFTEISYLGFKFIITTRIKEKGLCPMPKF